MSQIKVRLLNAVCGVLIVVCNTMLASTNGLLKRRNYAMLRHPKQQKSSEEAS